MSSLMLERIDLSHPAFVGAAQALQLRPDFTVQTEVFPQPRQLSLGEQMAAVVAEADRSTPAFSMSHNALLGKRGDNSNAEGLAYQPSVFIRGAVLAPEAETVTVLPNVAAQPVTVLAHEANTVVLDRVAPEPETVLLPKIVSEAVTAVKGLARRAEVKVHRRSRPTVAQAIRTGAVALGNVLFAPLGMFGHQGKHLATA